MLRFGLIDQAHIFVNKFNAKMIALTYCHDNA